MRYGVWAPIPQYASGVRKWTYGRNSRRITAVVIHRMDGTLDGSDSWLRSYKSGSASTHFGVGAMGWLNRMAGRYQIRQWVDTTNTAYGWAARPTDTPTPLARNTLGPDLYNSRADLNWQVIAIEVEGFYYQPWPAGVTAKVKELLNAIARSHGPLVIMAHTDISSKPCPGMATVPWAALGGYGGRIGVPVSLPDTSQDVMPVKFSPIVNRKFLFRKGTTWRTSPKYPADNSFLVQDLDRWYNVQGYVPGSSLNGENRWVARFRKSTSTSDSTYEGRWVYAHQDDVLRHAKIEE